MPLRFLVIAAAIILLAAIAICSLTPSPNMHEMWWIPDWLGTWADRNGNFRNMPVFAVFAALLFLVFNTCHAVAAPRVGGFVFSFLPSAFHSGLPQAVSASLRLKLKFQPLPLPTALRAAVCASALGVLLEVAQLLLPNRHADPMDLLWMTLGAFAGAFSAASVSMLLLSRIRVLRLQTVN